jgi:protease secretion system membrane fusion protein
MKLAKLNKNDVTDIEVNEPELATNEKPYSRLGWIIVIFGVLGFLLWASFAPLDSGVPLAGNVAVSGNRKVIQHQSGGTIDEVLVKEGQMVKAGQTLVQMNKIQTKANFDIITSQLNTFLASEARLLAERNNASSIQFPKELLSQKNDPAVSSIMFSHEQLFQARQSSLKSEIGAAEENSIGLKSQLTGLEESMISKKEQVKFLKEQVLGLRELSKDGYVARNRLLEAERSYAQLIGAIAEDTGNMGRLVRQISELKLRISQRQQAYQSEVRAQLSEAQKEVNGLKAKKSAIEFELNNIEVKAPSDGIVTGLAVFSKGTVVQPAFKMMELVPTNGTLIVEANLPVHLVDKVHAGLKVDMIFSAFNARTTPHIPGEVLLVGADRMVDERTGQAFYKVKAKVSPDGDKLLAQHLIRPGMPVELVVKTGERTMMNYLLRPILDRAKSSLKEE